MYSRFVFLFLRVLSTITILLGSISGFIFNIVCDVDASNGASDANDGIFTTILGEFSLDNLKTNLNLFGGGGSNVDANDPLNDPRYVYSIDFSRVELS